MKSIKIFIILVMLIITGIFSYDPPPIPGSKDIPPIPSPELNEEDDPEDSEEVDDDIPFYDKDLLPEDYVVYTDGKSKVVNKYYSGLKKVSLPTKNIFKDAPGCYIACYSKDSKKSVYPVGGGIYVVGQIRVPGGYENNICRPKNYETADISALDYFKKLCHKHLTNCSGPKKCWAGGSTYWH